MISGVSNTMHRQILLTGATGALGPALAAELVRTQAAAHIAVLLRGPRGELPARFAVWRDAVRSLLAPDHYPGLDGLYPVSGDICQDNLGLDSGVAAALERATDVVIHAAADTNFSAPPARQWAVNVDGTRRMLDWAAQCRPLRRFLLVSSVFVAGSRTGPIAETAPPQPPDFVMHYQRTKWEAEQVALASALPVGVARVSLVLGAHATGGVHRSGAVHSLLKWLSRGLVPMMPGRPEARGDVIATETAAQCLARAVLTEDGGWGSTRPPIWQIAAADGAPTMTELLDFVYEQLAARPAWRRQRFPRPQMVDPETFAHYIAAADAGGRRVAAQALRSVNRFLPDLYYPKTYQTTRAEALWGGPLPHYDWRQTLGRVLHFCCPQET